MVSHKIDTYRILISHRYVRSDEYVRLARMLDRAEKGDPTWHWTDLSVPRAAPIMTEEEARMGDTYDRRMRRHLGQVHVVLYIDHGDWLDDLDSLYSELVEGTQTRYRPPVPIINVLPRGADTASSERDPPGDVTVGWYSPSIIRAVRANAIPVSADELLLTPAEAAERAGIVAALAAHPRDLAGAARELGVSASTLRRRRMKYLIL